MASVRQGSFSNTLRSSSMMGVASILNIIFGIFRMKVAAVLLGPTGVGLIGVYQTLIATFSTMVSLGLDQAGTRHIAIAKQQSDAGAEKYSNAISSLFWGAIFLGILGTVIFAVSATFWKERLFGASETATNVSFLALGVLFTVGVGAQRAILNGLREVGKLSKVIVFSGLFSTIIGIVAIWIWGTNGIILFTLGSPLATFVIGFVFLSKTSTFSLHRVEVGMLWSHWRSIAKLGATIMLSTLVVSAGQLVLRGTIQAEIGAAALGIFTAAWMVSQYYVGFIYSATTADFFPRISAAIAAKEDAGQLINDQTEAGYYLTGALFIFATTLAPAGLQLLYSAEFRDASDILRLMVLGDILKVAIFPLDFALLAYSAGRSFLVLRIIGTGIFVTTTWALVPTFGLEAAGIGYVCMYVFHLPAALLLTRRFVKFFWSAKVIFVVVGLLGSSISITYLSQISDSAGLVSGLSLTAFWLALSLYSFQKRLKR